MSGMVDPYGNPETVAVDDLLRSIWGNAAWERLNFTFPTATERDAIITAPVEGMRCRLTTSNLTQWYNGSEWVNARPDPEEPAQKVWDLTVPGFTDGDIRSTSYSDTAQEVNPPGQPAQYLLPSVTVETRSKVAVFIGCEWARHANAGEGLRLSYSISGATTSAASDARSAFAVSAVAGAEFQLAWFEYRAVTVGTNTFQMEARTTDNLGELVVQRPRIMVIPKHD